MTMTSHRVHTQKKISLYLSVMLIRTSPSVCHRFHANRIAHFPFPAAMQYSPLQMRYLFLTLVLAIAPLVHAQTDHPNGGAVEEQQHAMQKLNYLIGRWTGEATLTPATGPAIQLKETETAQYKSDGTVLEISSIGFAPDGTTPRNSLATISYDEDHFAYHLATTIDGRPLTADFSLQSNGFMWAYTESGATTTTTMQLTKKGAWSETIQTIVGSAPTRTTLQMLLYLRP
jgi:hypothetical protein